MLFTETYSVSGDFPNQKVYLPLLHDEILASTIIVKELDGIEVRNGSDDCFIRFTAAINAGEKTELDAIVAAHQGEPLIGTTPQNVGVSAFMLPVAPDETYDSSLGFDVGDIAVTSNDGYDVYLLANPVDGYADWRQISGNDFPLDKVITVDKSNKDADHTTIQAAVDAALDGYTILIGSGEYPERITINKSLWLVAQTMANIHSTSGEGVKINPVLDTDGYVAVTTTTSKSVLVGLRIEPTTPNSFAGGVTALRLNTATDVRNCSVFLNMGFSQTVGPFYAIEVDYAASTGEGSIIDCYATAKVASSGVVRGLAMAGTEDGTLRVWNSRFFNSIATGFRGAVQFTNNNGALYLHGCELQGDFVNGGTGELWHDSTTVVLGTRTAITEPSIEGVLPDGSLWYDSDKSKLRAREDGVTYNLLDRTQWPPVRVATTSNVPAFTAGAPDPVDGVSLAVSDRILVRSQTDKSENGLYQVGFVGTGSNGSWQRADDADMDAEFEGGKLVAVSEGNSFGNTLWQLSSDDTITVGTTDIEFRQIANNDGGVYTGTHDFGDGYLEIPNDVSLPPAGQPRGSVFALDDAGNMRFYISDGTNWDQIRGASGGGGSGLWTLDGYVVELLDDGYILRVDEVQIGEDSSIEITTDGYGNMTFKDQAFPTPITLNDLFEGEIMYNKEIDEADDGDTIYIGEALPGTATSAIAWRIRRIVFDDDDGDDASITWADGNAQFDNIWDNRLSLSYS